MKFRFLAISLLAACLSATAAQAAAGSIAVVNIPQIMHDSTAAKSIKEQLDSKEKSFKAQISKKADDLQKEEQDLRKERAVLSPDAFDKKLKEFKERADSAQKDYAAKRAILDGAYNSALNEMQKAVSDIVSTIAKEKGYSLVLMESPVLYADPSLDITQDVLAQLNKTLPKVTVNFKSSSDE